MSNTNPATLALARLRQQAKILLSAARAADPAVLERLLKVPRLAELPMAALPAAVQLADCQHVIARQVGAESWPLLKQQLEDLDPRVIPAEQVLMFLAQRDFNRVRLLLSQNPELGPVNLFAAAATADIEAVEWFLAAGPPSPRHPRNQWTPLLYLAGSPLHADSPGASQRFLEVARRLLDAGADPNEHTRWSDDEEKSRLSALYRAVIGNNVPLVGLLLERGADPNDGESIYHGAEMNHRECLELLRAHGANISEPDPHWGNTPLHFLAGLSEGHPGTETSALGMAWLLEHGADPNVPSGDAKETPLHHLVRNRRADGVLTLLLDHGADPNARRADGHTPCQLAVRAGHTGALELLRARGA
ncbi:MAG: ankyrin repeat domain-containing protein, partial [Candidatus Eisenbacteria bacterium]|nr:ankyrin repeat domain-containing protein [Candidatus Eisenbacteria bacterium]